MSNISNILSQILDRITLLTDNYIFLGTPIRDVLIAYCDKDDFIDGYDGFFWSNEGYFWEFNANREIVKAIDVFFVVYRKEKFPNLEHINYCLNGDLYKTRYEYLEENNLFD